MAKAAISREGPSEEVARSFNTEYRGFLENMAIAFPPDAPRTPEWIFGQFEAAIAEDYKLVAKDFKRESLKFISLIMNRDTALFTSPDHLLTLPFMGYFPLVDLWEETVLQNEQHQDIILQTLSQLVLHISGVSSVDPGFMSKMEVYAEQMADEIDVNPESITQVQLMSMAGGMIERMQADGGMEGIMQAFAPGGGLAGAFDPEVLNGIMQSVDMGALTGGLQGMMSGSTGPPAFGTSVERPAWLKEEPSGGGGDQ